MFRIVCDPSSGSIKLYLTEIRSGSVIFFVCLIGVCQRSFWTSGVCVRYDGLTHTTGSKITLPNTDKAHDKHQWTTTNFSQVQLYTPWWWMAYDPKHVGVIFNFMSFKIFIQRRFWLLRFVQSSAFSRLIKVIDCTFPTLRIYLVHICDSWLNLFHVTNPKISIQIQSTYALYIRHVKLRVPRGPYGSHLCCHDGHTRQLTEVIQ